MDRIYLNQTALSLGYIALKRIRALEAPSARLPSNPLLRHIGHIKILAACVEQVGPEVIIEYEINQDYGAAGGVPDPPEPLPYDHVEEVAEDRRMAERTDAADDVYERRYRSSTRTNNATTPLAVINEDVEDSKVTETVIDEVPRKPFFVTNVTPIDFDDGDYSMDELYDEYNTQDDDWETSSESEDGQILTENVPSSPRDGPPSPLSFRSIDTDSDEEDDIPCTPPSIMDSRSPPLDITMRHPITHELNKREQYRRQAETTGNDLSCGFVEQIEDVLCQEMRYLSIRGGPGEMRLGSHTHQHVSLYA
jgi:hypothetical protein